MSASRRNFLSLLAAGGAAPFLQALIASAGQIPPSTESSVDVKALQFWQKDALSPHVSSKARAIWSTDDSRHPEFTVFDPEKGFRAANQIPDTELLDKGDVNVSLRVLAFKPADEDLAEFANIQTGSLRIDFQQTRAKSTSQDPLVWTAFAGVQPDSKGKLPSLQNTGFNPGTTWGQQQAVMLPGGAGLWGWNFFVQKKESLWCQVVSSIVGKAEMVAPLFGFPGLAVNAISGFNHFFGFVVAQTHKSKFLFQTVNDPAVATKDARQDAQYADALPLASSGHYVIVPRKHLRSFGEQMSKHEVQSGVVVPAGTKPHEVFDAAREALKDITYLTLAVSVRPI